LPKALTDKQEAFVQEYLVDLNATQAAIRAGYSENSAKQIGHELMGKAEIQEALASAMKARADRLEVKADDILRELMFILKSDLAQAYDEDGRVLPVHQMPENFRRALAAVEVDEILERDQADPQGPRVLAGFTKKLKLWDKTKAAEMLGKYLKLWVDKVEHDFTDGLADRLEKARQRVAAAKAKAEGGEE
jgi:phage terminase small subunit